MKGGTFKVLSFFLALGVIAPPASTAADDPVHPVLRHNPFHRPPLIPSPIVPKTSVPMEEKQPPRLDLRATLVSSHLPLANVGGDIFTVGDEIEGYRLIAIAEGEAVFARGKNRYTLMVGQKDSDGNK